LRARRSLYLGEDDRDDSSSLSGIITPPPRYQPYVPVLYMEAGVYIRVVDPDWFNTDPDPAFLLNADPDPS
jgi:hypothetical protein